MVYVYDNYLPGPFFCTNERNELSFDQFKTIASYLPDSKCRIKEDEIVFYDEPLRNENEYQNPDNFMFVLKESDCAK